MSNIKVPVPDHSILEVYNKRWSARAYNAQQIADNDLNSMFEAARWAASANNEQPWQFIYARRGTPGFDTIWACLMPGNQPWAKNANVLIVSIARKTFETNGKNNYYALHDVGMATSALLHQAAGMGLHTHPMAGVNKAELSATLGLTDEQEIACVIAAGYLDAPETLEEPFKTRELTPRTRKPITEFVSSI